MGAAIAAASAMELDLGRDAIGQSFSSMDASPGKMAKWYLPNSKESYNSQSTNVKLSSDISHNLIWKSLPPLTQTKANWQKRESIFHCLESVCWPRPPRNE